MGTIKIYDLFDLTHIKAIRFLTPVNIRGKLLLTSEMPFCRLVNLLNKTGITRLPRMFGLLRVPSFLLWQRLRIRVL